MDDLTAALREGELGLKTVPGLMRAVLKEGAWRERQVRTGKVVTFERFADFVTTPPIEGLGERPEMIKRLLHEDAETLAMFEAAVVGPKHKHKPDGSNPTIKDRGRAYTLRRLSKDRPDLFELVKAGEMTANQAAIHAGFRKVPDPLESAKRSYLKLTHEQRLTFIAWAAELP